MAEQDPTRFTVERAAQLANIPPSTAVLVLGRPQGRRPAHSVPPNTFTLDGEKLADTITSLPNLTRVDASSIDLRTTVLPPFPSFAPTSVIYIVAQTWPTAQLDITENVLNGRRHAAIPAARIADQASPPPSRANSQVRVVKVIPAPVSGGRAERLPAHVDSNIFREVVVDITSYSPAETASVGCMLGLIGQTVNDLSIRWGNPDSLERVEGK